MQVNAIALCLMEVGGFAYIPYTTLVMIVILLSALGGLPFVMGNGVYMFEELDGTGSVIITLLVSYSDLLSVRYLPPDSRARGT